MVGGARSGTVRWRTAVGWSLVAVGFGVFVLAGAVMLLADGDPGSWRLLALPLVLVGRGVKDGFGRVPPTPGTIGAATVVERLPGMDRWRVLLDDGADREVTVPLGWSWRGGSRIEPGARVVIRSWDDPPAARLLPREREPAVAEPV